MKRYNFLILLIIISTPAFTQQELSLQFATHLLQSQETNPAFLANREGFTIALPGFNFNLESPVAIKDLLKDQGNGETFVQFDELIDKAEDENILLSNVQVNTIGVGFSLAGLNWSLQHSVKVNEFFKYPKELPRLFWEGNAQYVGEDIAFGPDVQVFGYNEFALGLAKKIGKVSIGGRAKLLTGIGDASTSRTSASLYTSDDVYQLRMNTDYRVNASSIVRINDIDDIELDINNYGFDDLFLKNIGWAFDLGVSAEITDKLTIAASITDLGEIKWKENVENYLSKGEYTFEGIFLENIFKQDSLDFQSAIDTLSEIFDFQEISESYTTSLPTKFYLSGQYKVTNKLTLGTVIYYETFRDESFVSASVGGNFRPVDWLTVGANYSWRYERADNIGIQLTVDAGPLQFFALTDNVIGVFQPYSVQSTNGRVGLNVVF